MRSKLLGALVALGLAAAGAGAPAAQADPIGVKGCFGAATAVYCDPTVTGVQVSNWGVPVCTGSCTIVNVPLPGLDPAEDVCLRWTTVYGYPQSICA